MMNFLKPIAPRLEKEVTIVFERTSQEPLPKVADRATLLQNVIMPVVSLPSKMPKKVEHHHVEDIEEKKTEMMKETKEVSNVVMEKYAKWPKEAGILIYQAPGSTWICPRVALTEERVDVYTRYPESMWWDELKKADDMKELSWEWVDGRWKSDKDKPANFHHLSRTDQEAIERQVNVHLRAQYRTRRYDETSCAPVVILDEVEDLCDAVLRKEAWAMQLHDSIMEKRPRHLICLSQFPCYRDPDALPILFQLILGTQKQTQKTRSRNKGSSKRLTRRLSPPQETRRCILHDESEKMPKWATHPLPFEIERCKDEKDKRARVLSRMSATGDLVYSEKPSDICEGVISQDDLYLRYPDIHTVHILEPPSECLVQIFRVGQCARHAASKSTSVRMILYVTGKEDETSSSFDQNDDSSSYLHHYRKEYLGGDKPRLVCREEKALERLLEQDRLCTTSLGKYMLEM